MKSGRLFTAATQHLTSTVVVITREQLNQNKKELQTRLYSYLFIRGNEKNNIINVPKHRIKRFSVIILNTRSKRKFSTLARKGVKTLLFNEYYYMFIEQPILSTPLEKFRYEKS